MKEIDDKINNLLDKLVVLLKRQDEFSKEINDLREELISLKIEAAKNKSNDNQEAREEIPLVENEIKLVEETVDPITEETILHIQEEPVAEKESKEPSARQSKKNKEKSNIEKFIGENLINKIGIAITAIGVGIGAKYSIDHDLISPMTRIILGYLLALGLLGFGIRLKKKYENFSAVLVGGAIAILYFLTYAAYSFYQLIPMPMAFGLMLVFTAFSVVAAINYNKQVIAHIGLVGAYAIPFLLSNGSGEVRTLFIYMSIINIGILFISFLRYWKALYYSSFVLSWLVFFGWFMSSFNPNEDFGVSMIFLSIFFVTFYTIFLAYKLLKKEKFDGGDIVLLLANSFIFYGLGSATMFANETGIQLLGLFTLCNAVVHFIIGTIIYNQKLADKNLFYLVVGLVLTFITIAIPVQLDGSWVTLLWVFEAALLFWIGRTKLTPVYEKLSYVLMFLAFFSLIHDWSNAYVGTGYYFYGDVVDTRFTPIFNVNFLTALLFIASFAFINYVNSNKKYLEAQFPKKGLHLIMAFSIPTILLIVLYNSFQIEISNYYNQLFADSFLEIKEEGDLMSTWNYDLLRFKSLWIMNYSLLFGAILALVNINKLKNRALGIANIGFNILVILIFLTQGLNLLAELRESYIEQPLSEYYQYSVFNIGIRYISFVLVGVVLMTIYKYIQQDFLKPLFSNLNIAFDLLLYGSILCLASNEFISWMDLLNFAESDKLGLSILWGVYALLLVGYGIWKNKKHIRIAAIGLLVITLVKLFLYDISDLNTIGKTIVFVSLGILLLIISFLYNKYKHLITPEDESEN